MIDQTLVAWATADLNSRMTVGGQGTEKIFQAIGAPVAPALLPLLVVGSPDLLPAARFVGQLGDEGARTSAARSLVAILRSSPVRAEDTQLVEALSVLNSEVGRQYLFAAARKGPSIRASWPSSRWRRRRWRRGRWRGRSRWPSTWPAIRTRRHAYAKPLFN